MKESDLDYHRAQLEALSRAVVQRHVDPGPPSCGGQPSATSEGPSQSDLLALRGWMDRLKYAGQSHVVEFSTADIRDFHALLERVLAASL